MASRLFCMAALLVVCSLARAADTEEHSPRATYDFSFGMPVPGITPQPFSPAALKTGNRGAFGFVFPAAGGETYFTMYQKDGETPGDIARMKFANGAWQAPQRLPVNSDTYENDATVSGDGNTLIFRSWRALPDGTRPQDHSYLWISRRKDGGWETPEPLLAGGQPIRSGFPSLARSGTVYFSARKNDVAGVYRIHPDGDTYTPLEFVIDPAQPPFGEGDLFVDPDERYLVVSIYSRDSEGNAQGGDLYVLYRQEDGGWSPPIPFGPEINSDLQENCPQVTPDGRFFMFHRYDRETGAASTWWLDAAVIERIKP